MGKVGQPKRESFLAAYALCGNITHAAQAADCHRNSHYQWLEKDEDGSYAAAFDSAQEGAIERLESEARRRAERGVAEPVYYKGEVVGTVQKYSDVLLIFLLKSMRPGRYRDRVEHTGDMHHTHSVSVLDQIAASMDSGNGKAGQGGNGRTGQSPVSGRR